MPRKLAGLSELAEMANVSEETILRWRTQHRGSFPEPLEELRSGPVWDAVEYRLWLLESKARDQADTAATVSKTLSPDSFFREKTLERIADRTKHAPIEGRDWLGSSPYSGAGKINEMLLDGADMKELMKVSGRQENAVRSHLQSLKKGKGLRIVRTADGKYKFG